MNQDEQRPHSPLDEATSRIPLAWNRFTQFSTRSGAGADFFRGHRSSPNPARGTSSLSGSHRLSERGGPRPHVPAPWLRADEGVRAPADGGGTARSDRAKLPVVQS